MPAVAAAVAALGERVGEGDDLRACASMVAEATHASADALPPVLLMRLMVAATKSLAVAQTVDIVVAAAAVSLHAICMDAISKLLLAAAKTNGGTGGVGVKRLIERVPAPSCS